MSEKKLLDLCVNSFDDSFGVKGNHWGLDIALSAFFDGEGMAFHLEEVAPKTLKISTTKAFSEWLAYATLDYTQYEEEIRRVARIYGAEWDEEKGELFIRFKRNEMRVGQAYFRLLQAMGVIGNFRYHIYFEGKE